MKNIKNLTWLLTIIVTVLFFSLPAKAQVNIGKKVAPQSFSILELSADVTKGGLRLPQLNEAARDNLTKSNPPSTANGLVIYNTDNDCLEFWNGTTWISLCSNTSDMHRSIPVFSLELATIGSASIYNNYKDMPDKLPKNSFTDANLNMIDKIIVISTGSTPETMKWAAGTHDETWFASYGTPFDMADGVPIFDDDTYSVYLANAAGGIVHTINTSLVRDALKQH